MSHHIVKMDKVTFSFPEKPEVLKDVSFTIRHGESVAIIGENGAGKSTLLAHLNGLYLPDSGTVRIGDLTVHKKSLKSIRKTVGMVFQNPDDQLFMPDLEEDIAFGLLNMGMKPVEAVLRVTEILSMMNISGLRNRHPAKLSGGEKRMAALAGVLAMWPDILVLDEPSSNLDPRSRRQLINILSDYKHTKIIATHDLDMVLDLCDRAIVLHNGEVVADDLAVNIFKDRHLLDVCHLEQPFRMQACPVCGGA